MSQCYVMPYIIRIYNNKQLKTMRIIVAIAVITALLVNIRGNIVISSPMITDFTDNSIDYFYANFGEISYGKTLTLDLLLFNDSFCDTSLEFEHLQKPTYIVIRATTIQGCSYTKRTLFAQSIGAKGIIIATDISLSQKGNVIHADDGNGKKVHISCFFITPATFDKLRSLSKVQIIANFPVPQQKVSTLYLFLSASKRSTYVFLRELRSQYSNLKNHLKIEVIYQTVRCASCSAQNCYLVGFSPQNTETYCAFDQSNRQYNVGQKIILQQLQQYYIFLENGVVKWLDYMSLFDQNCNADWNNIQTCTKNIKNRLKITSNNLFNHLEELTEWRIKETQLGFDRFPEVAINNMIYQGSLNVSEIFNAVCDSLIEPPKYCISKTIEEEPPKNNNLLIVMMSSFLALIVFTALGICIYRKLIKKQMTRDMSSRVDELVANYANNLTSSKKRKREKLVQTFDQQI